MSELKLCPINRMCECVKEKCGLWIEDIELNANSEGEEYLEHRKIGLCSLNAIAVSQVKSIVRGSFLDRARNEFAKRRSTPIEMKTKKPGLMKRIFGRQGL